jgi:hypothetical protein
MDKEMTLIAHVGLVSFAFLAKGIQRNGIAFVGFVI